MTDRDYFHTRAQQEQERATRAHCPEGRRVHDELAARYRARADERPTLHLVAG